MAFTISDIAREVVANLGLESGYELGAQWVAQRYAEVCSRAKFRHLRQYGQLYLPAPITTGTCTATLDSDTILLDPAALLACQTNPFLGWPDEFTGLFWRPQTGRTWYRIAQAQADGTLILETPFAQDNGFLFTAPPGPQSGLTFYIIPRYAALNPTARQLGVFVCDFMYRALEKVSEDWLNVNVPNRFLVWAFPQWIAELNSNLDITGIPKMVEPYPYPITSVTVHYTYWQTPPTLTFNEYLPPTIDPDIVRTGAMGDACMNRAGKEVRAGNLDRAAFWTNRGNQYLTQFESKIGRAARNDRGAEDLQFILKRGSWRPGAGNVDYDPIQGAYENFLARGY